MKSTAAAHTERLQDLYLSDTSMATAAVSGTVAMMIEGTRRAFGGVKPSPNALKAMLVKSAFR